MIFVGYEPGSKGYQFRDTAPMLQNFPWCEIWWILISCKRKVTGTAGTGTIEWLPISRTIKSGRLRWQFRPSQPLPCPPSPGWPTQVAQPPQPPILPLAPPGGLRLALPDVGTALTPWYSLCPRDKLGHVIKQLETTDYESLQQMMIHMFQDVPNSFWEAMSSPEVDKWRQASEEGFEGLTEMGIWKLVPRPKDRKMIKCRWTYMLKYDSQKAWLVTKWYTQVQGIYYEETFSPVARYESIR